MTDRDRNSATNTPPADHRTQELEGTDIERAAQGDTAQDTIPADSNADTPLEPTGMFDGNSGTGGVVKNQDETAQ